MIEEGVGFVHRFLEIIHDFAKFEDLDVGEFFAQDVAEAHLSLFMAR